MIICDQKSLSLEDDEGEGIAYNEGKALGTGQKVLTNNVFPCIILEGPNAFTQTFPAQQGQSKLLIYEKYSP